MDLSTTHLPIAQVEQLLQQLSLGNQELEEERKKTQKALAIFIQETNKKEQALMEKVNLQEKEKLALQQQLDSERKVQQQKDQALEAEKSARRALQQQQQKEALKEACSKLEQSIGRTEESLNNELFSLNNHLNLLLNRQWKDITSNIGAPKDYPSSHYLIRFRSSHDPCLFHISSSDAGYLQQRKSVIESQLAQFNLAREEAKRKFPID